MGGWVGCGGGHSRARHGAHRVAPLPVQVDIIVSEWMGYYLLRESMFDSVRSSVCGRLQLCLEACSSVY